MDKKLKIKFEGDPEAIKHFMSWLDGQGEQDYWTWMECRESEESGDITTTQFEYDYKSKVITGNLGRLSAPKLRSSPPEDEKFSVAFINKKIKESMKMFGEYHYFDKGPEEVIDFDDIISLAEADTPENVMAILVEVGKSGHAGERFVSTFMQCVDCDDWAAFLFEEGSPVLDFY